MDIRCYWKRAVEWLYEACRWDRHAARSARDRERVVLMRGSEETRETSVRMDRPREFVQTDAGERLEGVEMIYEGATWMAEWSVENAERRPEGASESTDNGDVQYGPHYFQLVMAGEESRDGAVETGVGATVDEVGAIETVENGGAVDESKDF